MLPLIAADPLSVAALIIGAAVLISSVGEIARRYVDLRRDKANKVRLTVVGRDGSPVDVTIESPDVGSEAVRKIVSAIRSATDQPSAEAPAPATGATSP